MAGTLNTVAKVRIMAELAMAEEIAELVVGVLEGHGYQVIEWTKPHPCPEPDEDKSRVFITTLFDGKEKKNEH